MLSCESNHALKNFLIPNRRGNAFLQDLKLLLERLQIGFHCNWQTPSVRPTRAIEISTDIEKKVSVQLPQREKIIKVFKLAFAYNDEEIAISVLMCAENNGRKIIVNLIPQKRNE